MTKSAAAVLLGIALTACAQTRANLPGESAPPTQSPPPLTVAPTSTARTDAPATAAAATPRRNFKIGEPVGFADGWRITVLKIEEQTPKQFFTPAPGMRNVAVYVRHDNGSTKPVSFNFFYFKLQDGSGIRRSVSIFAGRDDNLASGELAAGAFVVGSLTFEAPVGDRQLQLIYEQIGYAQTTFELY